MLIKYISNPLLESYLESLFLGTLLVAITVSVRVPARNRWHAQEDNWSHFNKRTVYKGRAELSEQARHSEARREFELREATTISGLKRTEGQQ